MGLGPSGNAMAEEVMVEDPGSRGEGHMPQGQEQEGRRSCLPRELRIELFDEVGRLRKYGLTYTQIIDKIWWSYGVRLSRSNVSFWLRRVHSPYTRGYIPSIKLLKPYEELAYVIGVNLGDGYAVRKKRSNKTKIGVIVKDKEFAAEFGRCLAKVLGRGPIKPSYRNDVGKYVVEVRSQTLCELLERPVELGKLKKYIEHCNKCTAAFLRGFADSEGSVNMRGYIYIYNTNRELLEYIKELLVRLGIETTGPWPIRRQGKTFYDPRAMKSYAYKKDYYYLYIQTKHNQKFYKVVGFTIKRKLWRLENYVKKHQTRK
jgi:intein-encoded DNA endonuclease-like protein